MMELRESRTAPAPPTAPSAAAVLIVDDNEINLKLSRILLTKAGYQVRTAADAEQAWQMLAVFRPALIVMDIQLPGMDGIEFARRLQASPETSGIVLVACSASAEPAARQRALEAGYRAYLTKPLHAGRFASQIAEHLPAGASPGLG